MNFKKMILIISIAVIILFIVADQLLKVWAVKELLPIGVMDFIKFGNFDVIGLRYVENDGAAFSSFSGAKIFLIVLTSLMIVGLAVYALRDKNKHPFMMLSTATVIAGGIGNLIDRIRLGYVIDYIEVRMFDFAIFNFADICVVVGAICLVIYVHFVERKAEKSDG